MGSNYVGQLQERAQAGQGSYPLYELLELEGESHCPTFTMQVRGAWLQFSDSDYSQICIIYLQPSRGGLAYSTISHIAGGLQWEDSQGLSPQQEGRQGRGRQGHAR